MILYRRTSKHVKSLMNNILKQKYPQDECTWIEVPDIAASNILVINGNVFFPAGYPESQKILEEAIKNHNGKSIQNINEDIVLIEASEAAKADGALTCSCVLFQ